MNKKYIIILSCFCIISMVISTRLSAQSGNSLEKLQEGIKQDTSSYNGDSSSVVDIAFGQVNKDDVIGFVTALDATDIFEYDHTIWLSNALAGRTLGLLGTQPVRGLGRGIGIENISGNPYSGAPTIIVDGLPRNMRTLRLSEIKNISVLRDVNSAMLYGSDAINGVILITTKRGRPSQNQANFTLNYGVSTPKALPKYLSSAEYMTYYNLARSNDGLSPQYSDEMIQNYQSGNKFRYPNVNYYSDKYLKSAKNYFDLNGQFSGGNDVAQYYANLGWNSSGGLLNFGEGAKARDNKFNVLGNVDLKISDWINTSVDAAGFFVDNKGPVGNYWGDAATIRPFVYTPLIPINLIDPNNKLLVGRKNDVDDRYLIGGNSNHLTTPFGDGYAGGVLEGIERNFSFDNRININLNKLTRGLSFHTNISFNYYTRYNQTVDNQYSVYQPVWSSQGDSIIDLEQYGKDSRSGIQSVGNTYFRRRFGAYGLLSYDRTFNKRSHFTGSFLAYLSNLKRQGDFQGIKQAHVGLRLGYVYDSKYMIDFSGAYINSVKLAPGHRGGFSPSLGFAWVISKENFMSSAKNINYLKLRVSAGVIKSDFPIGGFYYYDSKYGGAGGYSWDEGIRSRSGTMSDWGSNPDLGYVNRKEANIGLEGRFFNDILGAQVNFFYDQFSGLISRPQTQYPSFYSDFIPYENYGVNEYYGTEIGLNFNKSWGNWKLFVGGNLLYNNSKVLKMDEVYKYKYQYHKGHPADARFGLVALGLFQSQEEIDKSPKQTFGKVRPGDIKYKDQNADGIIDNNDEVYIGRYQTPLFGGLQFKISFKNATLYILGVGKSEYHNSYKDGNYYWIDGNMKYSEVVKGSWTPQTKNTATFPRLSSQSSANNFRQSTYWEYNNGFFQIRRVQFTYQLPKSITKSLAMSNLNLFIDATNIYQFAKDRKILNLNPGGEPRYRTFSIGLNANF